MENKNKRLAFNRTNLLNDLGFVLNLKFEVTYAGLVRGGHFPLYFGERKRRQLVADPALFNEQERKALSTQFLIFSN